MYTIIVSIFTAIEQISCYLGTFKIVFTILRCMYLDCMFEQLITHSYQLFFESLIIFLPEFLPSKQMFITKLICLVLVHSFE